MSIALRHVVRAQRALLAARQMPRLCTPVSTSVVRSVPSTLDDGANKTHDHSLHFKVSKPWRRLYIEEVYRFTLRLHVDLGK